MIGLALALTLSSVRPEPVEGRPAAVDVGRPSTSSGRRGRGRAAARAPQTALDAERAFAADAQTLGQWAAFRKWAGADAIMFVPQPTNAQAWLRDRVEPAHAVEWSPTASYQSCDGNVVVNTGEWRRADGSVGYFTTVWQRQADGGWRWLVDSGDQLTIPRARLRQPAIVRAVCPSPGQPLGPAHMFHSPPPEVQVGTGASPDQTLSWGWQFYQGRHTLSVALNGRGDVINDSVAQ
ncbi:hypothetical protein [Sphingomonas sp.]|uniref:hypothetical protein n=1 Tax=Sphingomonas sp. TaxID=28214 RepID=UPI003CC6CDC2